MPRLCAIHAVSGVPVAHCAQLNMWTMVMTRTTRQQSHRAPRLATTTRVALVALSAGATNNVHCFSTAAAPFGIVRDSSFHIPNAIENRAAAAERSGWSFRGSGGGGSLLPRRMSTTMDTPSTTDVRTMNAQDKLDALRADMKSKNLDVYLVPSDDPHLSEYTPDAFMRRAYLTDFRGSAGTAVITQTNACLWTDSRYWNEANSSLDPSCWTLMKQGQHAVPTIVKWLSEQAVQHYRDTGGAPLVVGLDSYCHPASFQNELLDAFAEAAAQELGIDEEDGAKIGTLDTSHGNLIDSIWGAARPPVPTAPFTVQKLEYAGTSWQDKIKQVRKEMTEKKATLAVFSSLDDVVYALNVRAYGDISCNPVGIAYVTVSQDEVKLYCDERKLQDPSVTQHLSGVAVQPYDNIVDDIAAHVTAATTNKVWLEKAKTNLAIVAVIPKRQLVDAQNAIVPMKAVKNESELQGMRKAHLVDGAAMAKFMAWLEDQIVTQGRQVAEVEIDKVLLSYRAEQPGFKEPSFPTIAGVGPNGAIVHYRASEDSDIMKYLDRSNPILIDSGGQYEYGTTDVTRTWHFGEPTTEFKNFYTRVLLGHIGLDTMIFPENTPGFVLDVYARQHLWSIGKDYGHGTGHGVGAALNVHEGPMGISPRWANKEVLKAGMVVSNEPGYYDDGKFGIRIENLLEIQHVLSDDEYNESSGDKRFLQFSKLTMIPIQKNLINTVLLTDTHLDWLDNYHADVLAKVSPLLEPGSPAAAWLEKMCTPMDRFGNN